MQGKKLIASLMASGLLMTALAVPVTTSLAAAPENAEEASSVSVAPAPIPDDDYGTSICVPVPTDFAIEPLAPLTRDESPVAEESPAAEGEAVPISIEPDPSDPGVADGTDADSADGAEGSTASATANPVESAEPTADAALTQVTLEDLTTVAAYIAGKTELTPEEMAEFDLNGNGTVTLTDLTKLAAIYAAQQTEEEDPGAGLPEADPQYATAELRGEVTSIDTNDNIVFVKETSPDVVDDVGAVISDETIIIDCQSGAKLTIADLKDGDVVVAYLSMAMMPSLPPKAACYALIANLPEEMGMADYVRVSEINELDNGGVVVLNQNADLWVTIPADLEIGVFGEDKTASIEDIEDGTRLVVWYDIVMESYPAQTTALRCMIVPAADEPVETTPQPEESVEPHASPEPAEE